MQMREKEFSFEANGINKKHNNTEISRSVNTDGEKRQKVRTSGGKEMQNHVIIHPERYMHA